jgi:hypothetical protein
MVMSIAGQLIGTTNGDISHEAAGMGITIMKAIAVVNTTIIKV